MPEATDGTLLPIRVENALPERALMDPLERDPRDVPPTHVCREHLVGAPRREEAITIFDQYGETEPPRIILHDIGGPVSHIPAGNDAVQVHERGTSLHGQSQAYVVTVCRISPPVSVTNDTIRPDLVVIRARTSCNRGGRSYAERHVGQDGGLEDSLWAEQGHAAALEIKTTQKCLVRQGVWMAEC